MTLTHLSLFSGIGGIDLAAHWAGFETVAFCEQNKFCQEVLAKHWPGVPIYDDIFTLTATALAGRGIEPGTVTLISGGFPCQPYSHAGKRMGNADDRALWPQMLRVIREVRPLYVLGENVPGLISLALDGVLSDLESEGYTCQPFVLPACAVNAPHRRDRVFIIAHSNSIRRNYGGDNGRLDKYSLDEEWDTSKDKQSRSGWERRTGQGRPALAYTQHNGQSTGERAGSVRGSQPDQGRQEEPSSLIQFERGSCQSGLHQTVADTSRAGRKEQHLTAFAGGKGHATRGSVTALSYTSGAGLPDWAGFEMGQPQSVTEFERPDGREVERNFRGVATRVSRRVDRLRALGNSVVPQQVYPILKAIADYELQGQIA